jgi:hypothetical protein
MSTIQPIKNDQAVAQIVNRQTTQTQTSRLAEQPQKAPLGIDKSDKSDKSAENAKSASGAATNRLTALQSGKEASELQVLAVRTSKSVEVQLESAQKQMNEIVNSYPPFLRGSELRQQYLMSISSIRTQIEAMIIPPIQLDNPALLDTAASKEAKMMWAELFQGLGIPVLATNGPNEASDAQIRAASSAVGVMQSDLSGRRAALEQQVAPTNPISSPMAQYLSQAAGQGLAQAGLSLTTNLIGALKRL